jgi:hypothetical protein
VSDPSDETTKRLTEDEFRRVMRSANFVGAVAFWQHLERLADPESRTCLHTLGVLTEIGRRAFDDCGGYAYSPQQRECFEYLGFEPLGIRSPGSCVQEETE